MDETKGQNEVKLYNVFPDLKKMNISNNNLKKLPPLGELRKMEILDANHNDIEELPDFYGCSALRELYIANNYIKVTRTFVSEYYFLILNVGLISTGLRQRDSP